MKRYGKNVLFFINYENNYQILNEIYVYSLARINSVSKIFNNKFKNIVQIKQSSIYVVIEFLQMNNVTTMVSLTKKKENIFLNSIALSAKKFTINPFKIHFRKKSFLL